MATNKDLLMASGLSEPESEDVIRFADNQAKAELQRGGNSSPSKEDIDKVAPKFVMQIAVLAGQAKLHGAKFDLGRVLGLFLKTPEELEDLFSPDK